MLRSQLNSYSGNDPIWGFVAIVASERFTGEAAVGLAPRVHLFAVEGRVYYAEREGDLPIGERLVNCAAITAAQLEHGSVRLGEVASLARLFQRQPQVDRDAVELTIELATESLLESVANNPVGMPEVFPLRHHSSGVHHWLRSAAPTPAAVSDRLVAEPIAQPEPEPAMVEPQPLAIEPEPALPEPIALEPEPAPAMAEPEPEPEPEPVMVEPEPEPEPLMVEPESEMAEPEPEPVMVMVMVEPEPEPEPVMAEAEPTSFVPLSLTPLSAIPNTESEPQPVVEPTPTEPTFEPLPMLGLTPQSPLAPAPAAPSFDELDAVLGLGTEAPPAVEAPARTNDAMADLSDLPPISSLAFLSTLDGASDSHAASITELAELPTLAAPSSFAPDHLPVTPPAYNPMEPGPAPMGLPKLATGPVSVDNLDLDPTHMGDYARTGGAPTHTLAAVEIWELVDGIMVDAQPSPATAAEGDADDRRGRGWRRSKKS